MAPRLRPPLAAFLGGPGAPSTWRSRASPAAANTAPTARARSVIVDTSRPSRARNAPGPELHAEDEALAAELGDEPPAQHAVDARLVRAEDQVHAEKGYACNCSICARAGWLLAFVDPAALRLVAGEDSLADYQFGKRRVHHLFCRTCGVRPFSRGKDDAGKASVAVNLRCVAGIDPVRLPVETFDGASL